ELKARVRAGLRTRHLMELLSTKAMLDGLTGLWNRAYFDLRLQQEISLARRTARPLGCVMADIDDFQKINDTFGHPGGDEVLCSIAKLLANNCRIEDVICRHGGEKFAIIAPNTHARGCGALADRLLATIANTDLPCRGTILRATLSFGLTDLHTAGPQNLVEQADNALYRAKQSSRN